MNSLCAYALDNFTFVCLPNIVGWWTYEFCVGKHVRQFHAEGDKVLNNIDLGRYDFQSSIRKGKIDTIRGDGVYEEKSSNIVSGDGTIKYAAQVNIIHNYCNE